MAEGQLEESVTIRLLRQILDGLSFLHANNIAHLDVKVSPPTWTGFDWVCIVE